MAGLPEGEAVCTVKVMHAAQQQSMWSRKGRQGKGEVMIAENIPRPANWRHARRGRTPSAPVKKPKRPANMLRLKSTRTARSSCAVPRQQAWRAAKATR